MGNKSKKNKNKNKAKVRIEPRVVHKLNVVRAGERGIMEIKDAKDLENNDVILKSDPTGGLAMIVGGNVGGFVTLIGGAVREDIQVSVYYVDDLAPNAEGGLSSSNPEYVLSATYKWMEPGTINTYRELENRFRNAEMLMKTRGLELAGGKA